MAQEKSEFLKGTLDMLILKVVAAGGAIHGYAISQRIQQISKDFFQLQQGSLYPALHRLEEKGWLQAEWKDTPTGREAKFYRLTKKGRTQLELETANWERLTQAVSLILNHVSAVDKTVTDKVYIKYSFDREKRAALELWASRLEQILAGQAEPAADNVVEMKQRA